MSKRNEMLSKQENVVYNPEPTARRFHASKAFVRGLRGPLGSGKTSACVMELYTRALEQQPFNGVRRSRWCLIRGTYPELLTTTLKTFEHWVSPVVCPVTMSVPITGRMNVGLPDGTRVQSEFIFLAMDSADAVDKLKSFELTGAFINEASEIDEEILQMLTMRIGRYPDPGSGGATWTGVVMDTNPPNDRHWWYRLAELEKPKHYEFFAQPPAVIRAKTKPGAKGLDAVPEYVANDGTHGLPPAENIANLNDGFDYYLRAVPGKDEEWIKVFMMGEYGSVFRGKAVYGEYNDQLHWAGKELEPYRGMPVVLGFDFGLTPSCVFVQEWPDGRLVVLDELMGEDMGLDRFVRDLVRPKLLNRFASMQALCVGDPAGGARSQTDEMTCFQILANHGLRCDPAPTNQFPLRRDAVAFYLSRLADGKAGFQLSSHCLTLRKGFLGGYQFRRFSVSLDRKQYAENPDKNEYSHPHDALQYACLLVRSSDLRSGSSGGLNRPKYERKRAPSPAAWT